MRRAVIVAAATALCCCAGVALASLGMDISQPYDVNTFSCAADNGIEFVVVRGYKSYGAPDTTAPTSLANAAAAGIAYRSVYLFPCPYGVDPSTMVQQTIQNVGAGSFNTLYLDIETNPSPGCGWSGDHSSNCNLIAQLLSAGSAQGVSMGIYTSIYMWQSIAGSSCTAGADAGAPLWYAHYDYNPSFSDFQPFGGWSSPQVKQYSDSVSFCGISADADFAGGATPPGPPPPAPPSPGGGCYEFYEGLCPGASSCMCTLGEQCGSMRNLSNARNAAGGCSGQCLSVAYGQCSGDSYCLANNGPC